MKMITLAGCIAAALAPAIARAQAKDVLVQTPVLPVPDKASVAGSLSKLAFAPSEMARGSFSLPAPMTLPEERGPAIAKILPMYSPEGGISEWGMGWAASLEIHRYRVSGEPDYATDEFASPWGRLRRGDDGNWYPSGFQTIARAAQSGSDWIVTLGDGTRYTYRVADAVSTARGIYAWWPSEITTVLGDRTTFAYERNAAGRPFLRTVQYGGRTGTPQYQVDIVYELLSKPFDDYRSGTRLPLDRRVNEVVVKPRNAATGDFEVRWRYQLAYETSPLGPAFYLTSITKVYRSGDAEPPVRYRYDYGDARVASAQLELSQGLDAYLATFGDVGLQPDRAAVTDFDNDGLLDVENAATLAQIHQTAPGVWTTEALPPPTGSENPYCRPPPSIYNKPRTLARMTSEAAEPQVFSMRSEGSTGYSALAICDRAGNQVFAGRFPGAWQLTPNTRLVDLDRDHRPDVIRVYYGGYQVLHNTSASATGVGFEIGTPTSLSPVFTPVATYVQDFNGDGVADLIARSSSLVTVWFGKGGLQFASPGRTFAVRNVDGSTVSALGNYQFSFVDANRDGLMDLLLTQGTHVFLATNRGDAFWVTPVPGLMNLDWSFGYPITSELSGRGENEVVLVKTGHVYALAFSQPSTGLLQSADDGKGTVIDFAYARAAAAPALGARPAVLAKMTVHGSGEADTSYDYTYDAPRVHTAGKFLVGFETIERSSALVSEQVQLYHDDNVSGLLVASTSSDTTSDYLRFATNQFADIAVHGLPYRRQAVAISGVRSLDGSQESATRTTFVAFAREFCPTQIRTTSRHGTLTQTSTLASIAGLDDSLHCMAAMTTMSGTHDDASRDFFQSTVIVRNSVGQVERVVAFGDDGPRVLQDVTYDSEHHVTDVVAPGRGSTHVDYDPITGLVSRAVSPDGVVDRVTAFDPISDAVLERTEDRGEGVCQ